MKPHVHADLKNIDEVVKQHLPSVPKEQMESDAARVLQRLRLFADQTDCEEEPLVDLDLVAVAGWQHVRMAAAAAAVVVAVVATSVIWRQSGGLATIESADGFVYRVIEGKTQAMAVGEALDGGDTVRTNGGAGAMVALADGSRIEMRAQSELSLERADDGVRIRLGAGSIIVNAAKQPRGHLYVQTKDMTVSVVGTVFLVNTEAAGSRVAVIEGEVRVHEGVTDTKLRPGEQFSTSRTLVARPVKDEIAWSRHSDAYAAILASFARGMADTAGTLTPLSAFAKASSDGSSSAKASADKSSASQGAAAGSAQASTSNPQFEEASIRLCDPDNLPDAPAGARGGGANSFQMTPGRTHALCMTLATIIRHAYGYGPADLEFINPGGRGRGFALNNIYGLGVEDGVRVRRGPDWARGDHYTIDAVAEGAADAATMSGPMLRALLERRFQLKVHIESEQVPAFTLTVAKGGLKIKPVSADGVQADGFIRAGVTNEACESLPPVPPGQPATLRPRTADEVRRGAKPTCGFFGSRSGPNMVFVGGGVSIAPFARSLAGQLGVIQVIDKTGVGDKFNMLFEFAVDENTPGASRFAGPLFDTGAVDVTRAPNIFTALEEQLGLKLEPTKAPREFIVIDQVMRPSPN